MKQHRNNRIRLSMVLGVGFLLLSPQGWARQDVSTDAIIAIVNDDVITLKDLREYIAGLYSQLRIENKPMEEIKQIMAEYERKGLEKLIDDKLILAAAGDKEMAIRPQAVDKRIKDIKSRYENEDEFIKAINTEGMSISDLARKITDQFKMRYMVDLEVRNKIVVDPQDVTDYYNRHKDEFAHKAQVNLQSVFVSFNNRTKQEAHSRAQQARARLLAGEAFDKVFKEYSDTPSVGTVQEGQMVDSVEHAVFSLKLDEISEPIEVDNGMYIFKAVGIEAGRTQGLQEVKDQIYNKLFSEQFQSKFKEWTNKLRDKAYIEIK